MPGDGWAIIDCLRMNVEAMFSAFSVVFSLAFFKNFLAILIPIK